MANIDTELTALMNAVYGEEVRSAFRDALLKMNNDVIGLITREDLYQMTQEEFAALKTSLINQINAAAAEARETIPEDYSALSDTVAKILDASYPNIMWQAGSLSDTGSDQSSDYVCRSNFIPVTNILGDDIKSKLDVTVTGDYKVEVYKYLVYDRDKNFKRSVTRNHIYPVNYSTTENIPLDSSTADGYVRLVAGCVDDNNQPVSHVTYQGSVFTELKESLKVYTTLSWLWEGIEELETDLDEKITDLKADLSYVEDTLVCAKKKLLKSSINSTGEIETSANRELVCYQVEAGAIITAIGTFDLYGFFESEPYVGSQTYNDSRTITSAINNVVVPAGCKWIAIRQQISDNDVEISPKGKVVDSLTKLNDASNETSDAIYNDFIFKQRNIFPDNVKRTNGYYRSPNDGNYITSEAYCYTATFPAKAYAFIPGESYIASADSDVTSFNIFICFFNSAFSFISGAALTALNNTFTVPNSAAYMCISHRIAYSGKLQIEHGTTASDFIPNDSLYEFRRPVKEIDAINNRLIDINAENIDLFSYKNIFIKGTVIEGKLRTASGTESTNELYFISDYFRIDKNTGYIFSLDPAADLATRTYNAFLCFYDIDYQYISGATLQSGTTPITNTFTTPVNAVYASLSTRIIFEDAIQIEKGSIITSYEPPMSVIHSSTQLVAKNTSPVFYVDKNGGADFTSLVRAIDRAENFIGAKIYVAPGTYDLIDELKDFYGDSYFDNISASSSERQGIQLKNRVHIIFSSRSKVTAKYEGSNQYVKQKFSAFNANELGFTLENMRLETANTRYCIHDERSVATDQYINVYKNCKMKQDNSANTDWLSKACIGGGLGTNGEVLVENCVFESVGAEQTTKAKYLVSYHNSPDSGNVGARSNVVITGNYIKDGCSIKCSWYGNSEDITTFVVSNNSVGTAIKIHAEGDNPELTQNIEVFEWNNVIRS